MAKRGENIYKRKDGRWEGRYIKGRRPDGKVIYGYVYARKYKECREKLVRAKLLYMDTRQSVKVYGNGLVFDFMQYWLYGIVRPYVKVSTFSNYAAILDKWIRPFLGNRKLQNIGREEVQCFIHYLSEQGLSAGTVRNIYYVLYAAMKKAREYGYLSENPCEEICLPELEKKETRILTLQEQKQLEHMAKRDKNGDVILFAIYTGLRIGEICALTWKDVDMKEGVLYVSRTIRRIQCWEAEAGTKTMLVNGSAKSSRSARTIPLPACIRKMLKKHRETASGEYIFTCKGHPLEPRTLQYRFKALLRKIGLSDLHFHALRHTFATRCMEMHFDIKTLSEILGHASAKMTLDRYGHGQMAQKRAAMESLDRLFARSS